RTDIASSQHTDGPGRLTDFQSLQGVGQWALSEVDNSPGFVGTNNNLTIWLERQDDPLADGGITETLGPGEGVDDFLYVPPNATNLTVRGTLTTPGGPVLMTVCPLGASGFDCQSVLIGAVGSTNQIVIDKTSDPPLNAGTYVIHLCNQGNNTVT